MNLAVFKNLPVLPKPVANSVGTSTFLNPLLATLIIGCFAKVFERFTAERMSSPLFKYLDNLAPHLAPTVDKAHPPVANSQTISEPIAPTVNPNPPATSLAQKLAFPLVKFSKKLLSLSSFV